MATKKAAPDSSAATSIIDTPRWLAYMALDDIKVADRNAKTHADGDIAGSVQRFGYMEAMTLDERTGQLVAGHGRREHLVQLHASGGQAPNGVVVRADGVWLAPVMRGWASANDDEALAAGIALNRLAELGGWDEDELAAQLDELRLVDGGLEGIGFTEDDLDALRGAPADVTPTPGGDVSFDTKYKIVILCDDEAQQVQLLDELRGRGLSLQALFQ